MAMAKANQTPMFHGHSKVMKMLSFKHITSHGHSKNSLENKMFSPFKIICQFSCHTEIMKNDCEIQTTTPSSLHPLLL
jgi:hypothetical protein